MAQPARRWLDVDDMSTWPVAVTERTQVLGDELRNTTEYTNDLEVPFHAEDDFRALLGGCLVRAYHATRLLEHEVQMIRTQGLRTLSLELVNEKIESAREQSCISPSEYDLLKSAHVFAVGEEANRSGECSFFLPVSMLDFRSSGVNPLLRSWGGEAFSMSSGAQQLPDLLAGLGRPAIVVANIDLSPGRHLVFPGVQQLFVGRYLGLRDVLAGVHYSSPVPAECIVEIWQPGGDEFDRFEDLCTD